MKSATWNPPITVENRKAGTRRTVRTIRQARTVLHRNWPDTSGSRYKLAETACDEAMQGEVASEEARRAFIAAAIEAHLYLS